MIHNALQFVGCSSRWVVISETDDQDAILCARHSLEAAMPMNTHALKTVAVCYGRSIATVRKREADVNCASGEMEYWKIDGSRLERASSIIQYDCRTIGLAEACSDEICLAERIPRTSNSSNFRDRCVKPAPGGLK